MKVYTCINSLPAFNNSVLTIGSFDGVHAGHRQILQKLTSRAKDIGGESILITFDPHPRIVLDPLGHKITILNSLAEKKELIAAMGIDHMVIVPFDLSFSQQSPRQYVSDFLLTNFKPKVIIIGYDHRFGNDRSGDINMLKEYQNDHAFELIEIEKHLVQNIGVSSTKIRHALAEADIQHANRLLDHPYMLSGTVVKGDQLGRTIGYPTANILIDQPHKLIPPKGIYAVQVRVNNAWHQGMLYIGTRPTLDTTETLAIEVNLFNVDDDLYDQSIRLHVLEYIRPDKALDSLDQLQEQIRLDKIAIKTFFEQHSPQKKKNCVIAVLNYNGIELLKKFIPDLIRYSPEADICVIDNKSTDGSISYLKQHHKEVHIVALQKNFGFAEGYNQGLEELKNYTYTLLLNSDVRVTKDWLRPLVVIMDSHPEVAAVQPKIKSETRPEEFEYAGASGGFIDRWGYPYCRGRLFETVEKDHGQYDLPIDIHWCSGAAMLVRSDLYHAIGGLDSSYFAHQEEIDLCWRLRNAGYRLQAIPSSVIYHVGGATLSYSSPNKLFLNYRNNITTLVKNMPGSTLLWLIPWRFVLDKLAAVKFLFTGNFSGFRAISCALLFEVFNFPTLCNKRKSTQKKIAEIRNLNTNPVNNLPLTNNIIIPYYIKGIKKFSDLKL